MQQTPTQVLAKRVKVLEDEAEIVRRLADFGGREANHEQIYRFIATQADDFSISTLCRTCGVARSSYYAWAKRAQGPDEAILDEARLADAIYEIWIQSRRRYGSPRVTAQLWRDGHQVNGKKVGRIMAELGIVGLCGRRKIRTTVRDPSHVPAPDLVERDFTADRPDELWVGDLTYIPTREGFLYMASALDAYSRRLVGWSLADHLRTEICTDALASAAATRGQSCFVGTKFHSDHGCQYTSHNFRKLCKKMGITQSMGTVGDSYDNAMAESL